MVQLVLKVRRRVKTVLERFFFGAFGHFATRIGTACCAAGNIKGLHPVDRRSPRGSEMCFRVLLALLTPRSGRKGWSSGQGLDTNYEVAGMRALVDDAGRVYAVGDSQMSRGGSDAIIAVA